MMKIWVATILLLFSFRGFGESAPSNSTTIKVPEKREAKHKLNAYADLGYSSQYITDGFKIGNGQPVLQPSLRLINSTLEYSLMLWSSIQVNRADRAYDEYDVILGYNHNFLHGSRYQFNFHTSYDYWFFPNSTVAKDEFGDQISTVEKHGGKVQVGISMLNLIPLASSKLIPSYNLNYWIYWKDDRRENYQGGARHEFALNYFRSLSQTKWFKNPYWGAGVSLNYMDRAFGIRSGWSHSTASVQSGFEALGLYLNASLNQQWSYQSSVNDENEFWTMASVTKKF